MPTTLVVAAWLAVARHPGPHAAGVLRALPTITAPTCAWIADDRGIAFAAGATARAMLPATTCAMSVAMPLVRFHPALR